MFFSLHNEHHLPLGTMSNAFYLFNKNCGEWEGGLHKLQCWDKLYILEPFDIPAYVLAWYQRWVPGSSFYIWPPKVLMSLSVATTTHTFHPLLWKDDCIPIRRWVLITQIYHTAKFYFTCISSPWHLIWYQYEENLSSHHGGRTDWQTDGLDPFLYSLILLRRSGE